MQRLTNGLRKIAAGLRPFSESVWPGVRNDLFVAHESIYEFFANDVQGERVLDAGCGTGYGARRLLDAGARTVVGVDIDALNIRYAKRHYGAANLRFMRADIQRLEFPKSSFEIVTASNSLEHLHHPELFLGSVQDILALHGRALIAVPPIITPDDVKVHSQIHYHRSNLAIQEWLDLFRESRFVFECYSHRVARSGIEPNFASRERSGLTLRDFILYASRRTSFTRNPASQQCLSCDRRDNYMCDALAPRSAEGHALIGRQRNREDAHSSKRILCAHARFMLEMCAKHGRER